MIELSAVPLRLLAALVVGAGFAVFVLWGAIWTYVYFTCWRNTPTRSKRG